MSRDRPDSDQDRRLSKGSAPLSLNHPPGMETRGPGKEEMQELQGSKREEPHSTHPTLCRQKNTAWCQVWGSPGCLKATQRQWLDWHGKSRADHLQQLRFIPCASCPHNPALLRRSLCCLQLSRQLLVLKCCTRAVTQRLGLSGGHLAGLRPPRLHGPHL